MATIKSSAQITSDIITQARLTDPAISAEIGTPERKIIEAVAEMIANFQVDFSVLDSQHDIDAMSAGRLDAFLGNFGFARQQPTASTGSVIFSRSNAAGADILIPAGTQLNAHVDSDNLPDIVFITLDTSTLAQGSTDTTVAVQCTTPGTIGNVGAGAITGFAGLQSVQGVTSVTNDEAMTGGTDGENDAEYKVRFKNTIFRNQAGTYDQFLALAVAQESISKANVVGPISRYQEYIQIPTAKDIAQRTIAITVDPITGAASSSAGGYDNVASSWNWPAKRTSAASSVPYSKYTYDQSYYLTDGGLGANARFFRPFVDYVFNRVPIAAVAGSTQIIDATNYNLHKPNVTVLDSRDAEDNPTGNLELKAGNVLLLEHAYISQSSRNDYARGILNCVDVFVNGSNDTQMKSQEVIVGASSTIQSTDPAKWTYQANFARKLTGGQPVVGNRITPLLWQPVTEVPDSIKISDGTTTYTFYRCNYKNPADSEYYWDAAFTKVGNYFMIEEIGGYYGTMRARNGIEFRQSVNGYLPNGSNGSKPSTHADFIGNQFSAKYTYDSNVSTLQAIMEQHKQVTTDVLVHKARRRYFRPFVTIMYSQGVTQSVVNLSINAAIAAFFDSQYYGAAIQLSDILQVIHNVPGVDNVRWTADAGGVGIHKIEETFINGDPIDPDLAGPLTQKFLETDFFLKDDELAAAPTVNPVVVQVKAQNTWGTA